MIRLTEEERLRRAEQALKRVASAGIEVTREVIASQRIEGIDARRHFNKVRLGARPIPIETPKQEYLQALNAHHVRGDIEQLQDLLLRLAAAE